jgi:hypothetical protein
MDEDLKQKNESQLRELKEKLFELNLTQVFDELVAMGYSSVDSLKLFDGEALEHIKNHSKTQIPFLQLKLLTAISKQNNATFTKHEVDLGVKKHKPNTISDADSAPSSTSNVAQDPPSTQADAEDKSEGETDETEEQIELRNLQKIAFATSHIETKIKKGRWRDCQFALADGKLKPTITISSENSKLFLKCQCTSEQTTKVRIRVRTDRKPKRKNGATAQNLDFSGVKKHLESHKTPQPDRDQRSLNSYYFPTGRP